MQAQHIGWIGTGVMGAAMCAHFLRAGFPVRVHSRTRSKASSLLDAGAAWATSPRAVAEQSDTIFTMVGYPAEAEQVILGEDGVLAGARTGAMLIDMTSSQPALAVRIHAEAAARGVLALDAPVSGGDVGAREATLAIMVGGAADAVARATPLLQRLGPTIAHMGDAGAGQHTKVCNQILAASNMIGVVESLLYAHRAGLDQARVIDVIGSGAAASWAVNNLGRRIVKGDYAPGFFIKLFVKDMGVALDEARRMQLALPGLSLAHDFYRRAMATGLENHGTQALYRVLADMNGLAGA